MNRWQQAVTLVRMPITVRDVYNFLNVGLGGGAPRRQRYELMRITDRFRWWRIGRFLGSGTENALPSRLKSEEGLAPPGEAATVSQTRWATAWSENIRLAEVLYPPAGGGTWTAQAIEDATGRRVDAAYYAALREGRVYAPRDTALKDIAAAMGFPAELWERRLAWWRGVARRARAGTDLDEAIRGQDEDDRRGRIARLLNLLFKELPNSHTDRPYTNEELALKSGGDLTEEEIETMRDGRLADPPRAKLLALCEAFDVEFAYWSQKDTIPHVSRSLLALVASEISPLAPCSATSGGRSALDSLRDNLGRADKVMLSEKPLLA